MKKIEFKKAGEFVKNVYNKIGKKNIIVALAILVIGGAVFANYMLFSDPVDAIGYGTGNMSDTYGSADLSGAKAEDITEVDSYFSTTVLSRQKARHSRHR